VDPTIAAALIAGGISVASFAFNSWTTSRTLHAAREASLRDRQASVYQQILAFTAHRAQTRHQITRILRYDAETEARMQGILDSYSPPNLFELEGNVQAFCPDSVVAAFDAARRADADVWHAKSAHAEALELNRADPDAPDPHGAVALAGQYRARIGDAERADSALLEIVRDRMLGTRPPDGKRPRSLLGGIQRDVEAFVRKRRSLR
jgi:hypothetical protein